MWHKVINKLYGCNLFINKYHQFKSKSFLEGKKTHHMNKEIAEDETPVDDDISKKDLTCLIMPKNKYKQLFDLYIVILLLYTATYVPI